MACEELGEMPELDVGALLEKHGLVDHPQVGMLNKRKRVKNLNLLPTPPEIVAELLQDLERTRCDENLPSLCYERECMYKAALLRAEKKEIRLMQMLDEERKRGREEVRAFESRERCYMEASAWSYRQKQQLKRLIHWLQEQNADITRDYTQVREALNALTNTADGAELVLQLHLGRQLVKRIPPQARHMIGNSVAEAYEQMQKDAKHSATSTPERV